MSNGGANFLHKSCSRGEALVAHRGRPLPDGDPSLLEYLEQVFTRIELSRAEIQTEENGGLSLVVVLAFVLAACLWLGLKMG
jgi:hypothetical protein